MLFVAFSGGDRRHRRTVFRGVPPAYREGELSSSGSRKTRANMIHPTVVYLDTNTLHYIQLCLNIVAQKKLRLPIDDGEFTASVEELSDKEYRKACGRGFYTLKHFQENQWSGRYSPFSEVELQVGRIKGRAFESIARESVPDRIWSRRPEEREISRRVTTEQLAGWLIP